MVQALGGRLRAIRSRVPHSMANSVNPTTPTAVVSKRVSWFALLMLLTALLAVAAHVYRLGSVPRGLYVDETSIGYNAWQIAQTGHDEHGIAWPLYFRAFGEYKNPVYVYLLAGIYRLTGLSEAATRAASAFAWLTGSLLLYGLCGLLTKDRTVRWYAIVCIGFTPWLFSLSRISFEVISLYPLLALSLYAVYRAYETDCARWAVLGGIAFGLSMYAYSTFRLLAPLYMLAVVLAYPGRQHLRRHARLLSGFALTVLPLGVYMLGHWGNLTERFGTLTYLRDPAWTTLEKLQGFVVRYVGYFGPDFLAWHGDANLRHHTGYGGELLLATVALLAVGFVMGCMRGGSAFVRLLVIGVLLSPIAAALTRDHGHSLRAFSMAVFAIPLSVAAAARLREHTGPVAGVLLAVCAGVQASLYVADYFGRYPAASVAAFESYGFKQALRHALESSSRRVVVDEAQNQPYINVLFFRALLACQGETAAREKAIVLGREAELRPDDTFIVFDPAFHCVECRHGLPAASLYGVINPGDGSSTRSNGHAAHMSAMNPTYSPSASRMNSGNASAALWMSTL